MKYTCNEYRLEMILLGLKRQLNRKNLSEAEKTEILLEIKKIEKKMELD